jgi:hypothetical protein
MEKLINVDNVISVTLHKEKESEDYQWIPVTEVIYKQPWYKFWLPPIKVLEGGYYRGFPKFKTFEDMRSYINRYYGGGYKFCIDRKFTEGPYGTIYHKAYIKIKTLNGKYHETHILNFDSDEDALKALRKIENLHPDKFIII